jgi:hypothetical protein
MSPEQIQEQIDLLGKRASQRVSQLQMQDPHLQHLLGQIEAYKSIQEGVRDPDTVEAVNELPEGN